MLERKSMVEQIELPSSGGVQVKIALMIVEGDKVLSSSWHRTLVTHGGNAVTQMSYVQAHLSEMGEALLSQEDVARVVAAHAFAVQNPSPHGVIAEEVPTLPSAGPLQPKQ